MNPATHEAKDSGFALVLALTMMAFVLLLMLSMTLLIQVETANTSTALTQLRAKENARLALMVAVGDLQRYAGPDQRVTARAEILGNTIPESNLKWIGVWDTTAPTSEPIWLVSKTQDIDVESSPRTPSVIQAGYDPNNDGTYDEANSYAPTQVSLIEISQSDDTIAWWISDEGVKAPVQIIKGIEDKVASLPDGDLYLDYDGVTARLAPALHDPAFDFRSLIDVSQADDLLIKNMLRVSSTENLKILAAALDTDTRIRIDAEFIHSATLTNAFVLSNPIDGGLKKDLSYLKVLDSASTTQSDLDMLYADKDDLITPAAIDLINFRGNPTAFPTDEIIGMQLPFSTIQEAQNETADFTLAPVITEFQFSAGIAADGQGASLDTTTDSSLYLVYKAYLEIWNPYTIPFRIGDPALPSSLGYSDIKIIIRNLPDFTISNNDSPENSVQGSLNEISLLWSDSPSPKTLRPGMVFLQTLPLDTYQGGKGAIVEALLTNPASIRGTRRQTYTGDFVFSRPLEIVLTGIDSHSNEHEIFTSEITYPDFQIDYDGDNSATRFKRQLSIQAGSTGITKNSIEQPGYAFGFRFKMLDEQEFVGTVTDISDWLSKYDIRNRIIKVDLAQWDIADAWTHDPPLPYDFDSSATGYDPSDFDHSEGFKDDDFFTYSSAGGGRQDRIARFIDLPTSEITDVGIFRSLKFKDYVANSTGNFWGDKLNYLYDRYFFSTLPDQAIATWDGKGPLANSRIISYGTPPDLIDPDTASTLLLSNGFNLNSTSVKAWEKVLFGKSFGAQDLELQYEKNETNFTEAPIWKISPDPMPNVFFNNPHTAIYNLEESEINPRYTFVTRNNTPDYTSALSIDNTTWLTQRQYPAFWQPVREITNNEVSELAKALTDAIKDFGATNGRPFFSTREMLSAGVLDTAINNVPKINNRQADADRIPAYTPSHISSMTLMNALGSLSFVRSDTFRIKAISQTKDPITGRTIAKTECEAIVQRTPIPHVDINFGRKFQILDIKWKSAAL